LEKFVIHGGKPLNGDVVIGGAKNAAVAILPATILAADKCTIENLPCISDVMASLQILSELGASIRMISKSTYEIDTTHLNCTEVSNELSRQMRASYYFLGALLGRFGAGQVAMPGGCNLGCTSAPIMFRQLARSTTCGSRATFSRMVRPSAFTAASMAFMVAPTETVSKKIWRLLLFHHSGPD